MARGAEQEPSTGALLAGERDRYERDAPLVGNQFEARHGGFDLVERQPGRPVFRIEGPRQDASADGGRRRQHERVGRHLCGRRFGDPRERMIGTDDERERFGRQRLRVDLSGERGLLRLGGVAHDEVEVTAYERTASRSEAPPPTTATWSPGRSLDSAVTARVIRGRAGYGPVPMATEPPSPSRRSRADSTSVRAAATASTAWPMSASAASVGSTAWVLRSNSVWPRSASRAWMLRLSADWLR